MNQLLIAFIELCLFRKNPQDIPPSEMLLGITGFLVIVSYTITNTTHDGVHIKAIVAIAQILTFGGVVWLVLKIKGLDERWRQTCTALFGCAALFQFASWPFILIFNQGDSATQLPQPLQVHILIGFWYLGVMAHILRHALDTTLIRGAMAGLFCQLTTVFALLFVLQLTGIDSPPA